MNKGLKKFISIFVIICCLFSLTGCFTKEPISEENFRKVMSDKGLSVSDITSSLNNANITRALIASNNSATYRFELYQFDSVESSEKLYNATVTNLESSGGLVGKVTTSGKNYTTISLTKDSKYYKILRVDDKMIYSSGNESDKDTIKSIYKELGY